MRIIGVDRAMQSPALGSSSVCLSPNTSVRVPCDAGNERVGPAPCPFFTRSYSNLDR